MTHLELTKGLESAVASPEMRMASAKETAARLKQYGGFLGAVGNVAENKLNRLEKINTFAKAATQAYNESNTKRVDNMYANGTQLQKMGALKATIERVKGLDDAALKGIMQDKNRGRLERGCAKYVLEDRDQKKILDKMNTWPKLEQNESLEVAVKKINPKYPGVNKEYVWNCQRCAPTYEMRRRGYDVVAEPRLDYNDPLSQNPWLVWKNPELIHCKGSGNETISDINEKMASWGEGARAQVVVIWENVFPPSGHTFNVERINGKTVYIDPQTGQTGCEWYFRNAKSDCTTICRVDNLQPTDRILMCCKAAATTD